MSKNQLFFRKKLKTAEALGAPPPNPRWPPAAGALLHIPCYCFHILLQLRNLKACWWDTKLFCSQKQGYPSYATGNMTSFYVTSFSTPNVFFWRHHCSSIIATSKTESFCWWNTKIFWPPAQDYSSYATGNMTSLTVTSFSPPNVFFWRRHCS